MNRKMNGQAGFTLIELIVVIVILGILAVTAAPKFMNLTSDANASVVKGLSGSIKSAYQMVYAKSRLHTGDYLVCASEECSGKDQTELLKHYKDGTLNGVIAVTDKGQPTSVYGGGRVGTVQDPIIQNTIAGAVDLGIAWSDYANLDKNTSANPSDWIVYKTNDGIAFVPKSAPTSAKDGKYYKATEDGDTDKACGVFYKALVGDTTAPVVKVFVKGC